MNVINQFSSKANIVLLIMLVMVMSININYALNSSFQVVGSGDNFTEVEFNLQSYEVILNKVDGIEYQRIYHPEAGYMFNEGLPEIPFFTVTLAIPEKGTATLEELKVTGTEIKHNFNLFPSQGADMVISDELGFLYDTEFYKSDTSYPAESMNIGVPGIMRDFRYVNVVVFPFSFNPVKQELTVHNQIRLRVNYDRSFPGENEQHNYSRRISRSFENIYQGALLNYEQFRNPDLEYQARSILVIHHHSALLLPMVQQFVTWKREKGFEIVAASTETMSTTTAIKNYIQNAYDTWENPPEYVLLIGGGTGTHTIPYYNAYSAYTDHPYGLLEGNDDIPDVFFGRLPIANSEQLQVIWNKIRYYEREPYLGNLDWYQHALLVGDATSSSGISPKFTMKYVKELMLIHNPDYQFTEHYTSSASTVINNAFNTGMSLFPFRGYIGMAGWSANASNLDNGLMLPNCFFMTCSTLSFSNTSNTETIVNMGTPGTLKGAVAAVGMNTASTKTAFNNAYTGAFFYGIMDEGIRTMGETLVRGKIFLHQTWDVVHPSLPPYHTHKASLMGDPSMDMWIENPKQMIVSYNSSVPLGTNYLDLNVTDQNSQPIKDAWVTIRQVSGSTETIFATGYTDENGSITHFFSPDSSGSINLTVTKPDYIPHLGSISLTNGTSVALHNVSVVGAPNAGNHIGFVLTLKNYLGRAANSVNGTLTTDSPYISITNNYSTYGNIANGATAQSISEYSIQISPDTPSGYSALFTLNINEGLINNWLSRFAITINNGNLVPVNISFSGSGTLEPGQTADMFVTLNNNGAIGLSDLSGVISGASYGLNIIDANAYFGNVTSGGNVTNSSNNFVLSASGNIIPGTMFNLELYVYNSSGFEQTVPLQFVVGTVTVNDPLGPDAYGYRCYDDGDVVYPEVPNYSWIEIAPINGGAGINTGLQSDWNNLQQVMHMDLPFTFPFYGVEYEVVSICANGWISFGITEQATFRNYILPGPMGPNPVIAAFWDNLNLAEGGVYTHYDQNNDIFIIQWQNARTIIGPSEETFQIILYDPVHYFSATGDGNIKIQYKVFHNVNNSTAYGEVSNYSTIGIGDHTGLDGMTYTFANQYPAAARVLGYESALFFTTGAIDFDSAYITIEGVSYSGGASYLPQYGETLDINVTLHNIGAASAGIVTAILSTADPYITVLDNAANFGVIGADASVTLNDAFSILVADNVPNEHRALMNLSVQSDQGVNWQRMFYVDILAPELEVEHPMLYDFSPDGNNNGIIDPGELVTLAVPVNNTGGADSPALEVSFVSNSPLVTIIDVMLDDYQTLIVGETVYPTLLLDISSSISIGTFFTVNYTINYGSYVTNGNLNLNVGGEYTLQLGSGTATNGSSTANPINIWYRSQRGQTVYTAAELQAAGMDAGGLLTEFGYYVTSPPIYVLPNFIIRMKHTTASDSFDHDDGPFTTVYFTDSYMPTAGDWDMLILDTPFAWDGVSNILVDTAFSQVTNYSSSGQQRIYTSPYGYRYTWSDGSDQTNATTNSTSSNKPQAQMVFFGISAGDVDTRPLNLTTEMLDNAVYLDWDPPATYQATAISLGDNNQSRTESFRSRNGLTDHYRTVGSRTLLGYNVYRNGIKVNAQLVVPSNYTDNDLEGMSDIFYYVTAVYDTEESIPSNIVHLELDNRVDVPVFYPAGGYYNAPQLVEISILTPDATVRYTLNGTEPNESSEVYNEPILIEEITTLKAKGYKNGWLPSNTAEEYYVIMYPPQNVTISRASNMVLLQWTAVPGASGYAVYVSNNIDAENWVLLDQTDNTNFVHTVSPASAMGFYMIKAIYEEPVRRERVNPTRLNR